MSFDSNSLGSLVDRLSIINIKLWFAQEKLYAAEKAGTGVDAETVAQVTGLNRERNRVMTAIDQCLDKAAREGKASVDPRFKSA